MSLTQKRGLFFSLISIISIIICSGVTYASLIVSIGYVNSTVQFTNIAQYDGAVAAPTVISAPTHFLVFTDASHVTLVSYGIDLSSTVQRVPDPSWFDKSGKQIYFPPGNNLTVQSSAQRTLPVPTGAVYLELQSASGTVLERYDLQTNDFVCVKCARTSPESSGRLLGVSLPGWSNIAAKIILPLACIAILLLVTNWRKKKTNTVQH